jgi:hypothetical protein
VYTLKKHSTIVTALRSGRPHITNNQDHFQLRHVLEENPCMNMAKVKDLLTTPY